MAGAKERVERAEKYRDGEKDDRKGRGKEIRIPVFSFNKRFSCMKQRIAVLTITLTVLVLS